MDVTDHIKVNKPELKMPRCESGTDSLGIRYQGPVLSGMRGVKQQLELQAVSSPSASSHIRQIAPGGLNYLPPSPPTPPASDTRLEPDPMYAAQRRRLNNRADLCDPVLRYHLGLLLPQSPNPKIAKSPNRPPSLDAPTPAVPLPSFWLCSALSWSSSPITQSQNHQITKSPSLPRPPHSRRASTLLLALLRTFLFFFPNHQIAKSLNRHELPNPH